MFSFLYSSLFVSSSPETKIIQESSSSKEKIEEDIQQSFEIISLEENDDNKKSLAKEKIHSSNKNTFLRRLKNKNRNSSPKVILLEDTKEQNSECFQSKLFEKKDTKNHYEITEPRFKIRQNCSSRTSQHICRN